MKLKYISLFCLSMFAIGCGKSATYWKDQTKSPDPSQRLVAVHELQKKVKDKDVVVPALIEALNDENSYVRRDAARALGKFGSAAKNAVPTLASLLQDKEPSVRKAAATALKEIDPNALVARAAG